MRNVALAVSLAAALFSISGCAFRSHPVEKRTVTNVPLKEATLDQLVQQVNDEAARIQTLNATVDIASTTGGEKKGIVTEYTEVRGYVLVRKPDMVRMIGLAPIVRNRIFDMVSDGNTFRLSMPTRNKFITGSNDVVHPSKNIFENMRPQHIFDAVLVKDISTRDDIPVLEVGVDQYTDPKTGQKMEEQDFILDIVHRDLDGVWVLQRKIYFSRMDLRIHKQVLFNKDGSVATIANYDNFTDYDGIQFPGIIRIQRPQEEYSIQLSAVALKLNTELADDKFVLDAPAGAQLINMDEPQPEDVAPEVKPVVAKPRSKK